MHPEWLAIKLTDNGIHYTKVDNVFTHIDDIERAQAFSDRFASLDWPTVLEAPPVRSTRCWMISSSVFSMTG